MSWSSAALGVIIASVAFALLMAAYRRTRRRALFDGAMIVMLIWRDYLVAKDRAIDKPEGS